MSIIDEIVRNTGVQFRAATPKEVETLRSLGMPAEAIGFYRSYLPTRNVEIARVRLWKLNELFVENSDDAVPGCYVVPCGYTIFASNDCGDAYCFDRALASSDTAPIVL